MKQIPNILSVFRLILVGVFIWLFTKQQYLWCLIVYITAFGTAGWQGATTGSPTQARCSTRLRISSC